MAKTEKVDSKEQKVEKAEKHDSKSEKSVNKVKKSSYSKKPNFYEIDGALEIDQITNKIGAFLKV